MTCMRVGFSQRKNGLPSFLALSTNLSAKSRISSFDRFHPVRTEWASVFDLLLANLAPARLLGWVIHVSRPGVDHVARPDSVFERWRIVGVARVLHRGYLAPRSN